MPADFLENPTNLWLARERSNAVYPTPSADSDDPRLASIVESLSTPCLADRYREPTPNAKLATEPNTETLFIILSSEIVISILASTASTLVSISV